VVRCGADMLPDPTSLGHRETRPALPATVQTRPYPRPR
jgi:hypothetical protein